MRLPPSHDEETDVGQQPSRINHAPPGIPARISVPPVMLSSITRLNIPDTRLTDLPSSWLAAMPHLKEANISHNRLRHLPQFPPGLEHLVARHCELVEFPDHLSSLRELQTLDVAYNTIRVVPPDALLELKRLLTICLAHNLLTSLPAFPVQKLNACWITSNLIPGLPDVFGQYPVNAAVSAQDKEQADAFLRRFYPGCKF